MTTTTPDVSVNTVRVVWIDGRTVTFRGQTRVFEGVLHVYCRPEPVHIPLANIRYWQ